MEASVETDPLKRAIQLAGSEAKLGKEIGFTQVAINKAKNRHSVSPEMALAIHRFTGGEVPASSLRPDLWTRPEDVPVAHVEREPESRERVPS